MPPQAPTAPSTLGNDQALDPQVVALSKSIRQVESGGDPTRKGPSGEYGAYQFLPATWDEYSREAGVHVPLNQATLEQQNQVAYHKIKQWKDQGHNIGEVASMWNAGQNAPQAYLTNNVGINAQGVHYDTPTYAKHVAQYYQQYKAAGGVQAPQNNATPTPSSSTPENGTPAPTEQKGLGQKALEFAFPILEKKQRTPLQTLGDTALSAMWFVPGLGEVGGLAKGAGLLAKGAEAVKGLRGAEVATEATPKIVGMAADQTAKKAVSNTLLKGAATGYGVDVASNLSQGKTGSEAITPGLGTATGGLLGTVGGKIANKAADTATSRLEAQTGRLKTLQKALADNSTRASTPIKTLDQNGLVKYLKTTGNKVDATDLTNVNNTGALDNMIEQHSEDASRLVKSLPGTASFAKFEKDAIDAIRKNPVIRDAGKADTAVQAAKRRFASLRRSFGAKVPYTTIDDIRVAMNREFNPDEVDVARTIGNVAREYLYNGSGTNEALKAAMQNESELIKTKNFVEKLHGTTVPGGQLGKYVAQGIGSAAGGAVGSIGGPFGTAAGIPVGAWTAGKLEDFLQGRHFKPIGTKTAGLLDSVGNSRAGKTAQKALLRGVTSSGQ